MYYVLPPSSRNDYYDMMIENNELASVSDLEIILMGDLNFDYVIDESLSSNPIDRIENLFEMTQLVENATRQTLTTSTLIDWCDLDNGFWETSSYRHSWNNF